MNLQEQRDELQNKIMQFKDQLDNLHISMKETIKKIKKYDKLIDKANELNGNKIDN